MQAPSGQSTAPEVRALLEDGALAGEWVLDPRESSIRLKSKSMGLVPVNGIFRDVSGNGTISPDGEVSGTAIEHSLSGVFRFIVHKGKTIKWPRAENSEYYILMGIDHDLNRAMRIAVTEVIKFLVEEKGLTEAKAFSLASIAVDFAVSEVVDQTQVVSGKIPKRLFEK